MTRLAHSVALVFLAFVLEPSPVAAYHAGTMYDAEPGAGGGGGVFYTGSPRDRGWTCAACHVDAPGHLRATLSSDKGVFARRRYAPDQPYVITISMDRDALGLSSTRSNFNGMALSLSTEDGSSAGSVRFAAGSLVQHGDSSIVASASTNVGETEWTLTWFAPPAGTGRVTLYVSVVDGNGANSPPTATLTDPFGDDVASGRIVLEEGSAADYASVDPYDASRAHSIGDPVWRTRGRSQPASVASLGVRGTGADARDGPSPRSGDHAVWGGRNAGDHCVHRTGRRATRDRRRAARRGSMGSELGVHRADGRAALRSTWHPVSARALDAGRRPAVGAGGTRRSAAARRRRAAHAVLGDVRDV